MVLLKLSAADYGIFSYLCIYKTIF